MKSLRYAVLGAALAYFLDPQNGRQRRKDVIKRLAKLRSGGRQEELVDDLVGRTQNAQPATEEPAPARE
jgi:hypothetical protein